MSRCHGQLTLCSNSLNAKPLLLCYTVMCCHVDTSVDKMTFANIYTYAGMTENIVFISDH